MFYTPIRNEVKVYQEKGLSKWRVSYQKANDDTSYAINRTFSSKEQALAYVQIYYSNYELKVVEPKGIKS